MGKCTSKESCDAPRQQRQQGASSESMEPGGGQSTTQQQQHSASSRELTSLEFCWLKNFLKQQHIEPCDRARIDKCSDTSSLRAAGFTVVPPVGCGDYVVLDEIVYDLVFVHLTRFEGRWLPLMNHMACQVALPHARCEWFFVQVIRDPCFSFCPTPEHLMVAGGKTLPNQFSQEVELLSREGEWHSLPDIPAPPVGLSGAGVVQWANKIYVIGGFQTNRHDTTHVFDVMTNTWSRGPDVPRKIARPTASVVGGVIYLIGGFTRTPSGDDLYLDEVYTLDLNNPDSEWQPAPSMLCRRTLACSAVVDGLIYVCGGYTGSEYKDSMERYDPAELHWTPQPPMPYTKSSAAIGVVEHQIVVAGGYSSTQHSSTACVFDTQTGVWGVLAPMGISRTGGRGAVVDGRFYVVGGWHLSGKAEEPVGDRAHRKKDKSLYLCSYSVFDLMSGEWSYHEMPTPRVDAMVIAASVPTLDLYARK